MTLTSSLGLRELPILHQSREGIFSQHLDLGGPQWFLSPP
jgi:hypothetical protein